MGRPSLTLTPAQMAEVETLAAVLTAEQVADYFGISRTTIFAIPRRAPGIAAHYKKGKVRAISAIAQTLISKARSGTTSMIFHLKTQGGWRETAGMEHEHRLAATEATQDPTAGFGRLLDKIAQEKRRIGEAASGQIIDQVPVTGTEGAP